MECLDQSLQFGNGGALFTHRRKWVYRLVVQQLSLSIQAYRFAPRSESWVYGKYPFLSQWRRQQQLTKVFGKNPYGLLVGFLLEQIVKFRLDRGLQQPFVAVFHGHAHLLRRLVAAAHKLALQHLIRRLVVLRQHMHA